MNRFEQYMLPYSYSHFESIMNSLVPEKNHWHHEYIESKSKFRSQNQNYADLIKNIAQRQGGVDAPFKRNFVDYDPELDVE